MSYFDDFQKYLPQYLSPESQKELFSQLNEFPDNINKVVYAYSFCENEIIYQGDGFDGFLITNLPKNDQKESPCIILSNTCDVNAENERKFFIPRIMYCPIMSLDRYSKWLSDKRGLLSGEALEAHLKAIKDQHITSFFYLPKGANLLEDSIALLDRVNNCDLDYLTPNFIENNRLFSLSNYGFYLFLFKLSVHFTRVFEKADRI